MKSYIQNLSLKKLIYLIIAANALLRLIIAIFADLGVDEVYYTQYALYPDWSYFDHPPMVGYTIWLSTFGLALFKYDFFIRLASLIIGTINIYLIYRITWKLSNNEKSALISTLMASASVYLSIISGTFILPDTPLTLFWLLAIYFFIKYISSKNINYIIYFAIVTALAFDSKYQAVFLIFGAFLYLIFNDRKVFSNWKLYLAVAVALLIIAPVIYWNLTSQLTGAEYHSSRVTMKSFIPNLLFLTREILGEVLYHNPFNFAIIVTSYFVARRINFKANEAELFLLLISLPLIIVVVLISFYNATLPHWTGPSYIGLTILAAIILGKFHSKISKIFNLLIGGNILIVLVVLVAVIQIKTAAIINPSNDNEQKLGINDFTTEIGVWEEVDKTLSELYNSDLAANKITQNPIIYADKWFPAAHLDYYFAQRNNLDLIVSGKGENLHQYTKINKDRLLNSSSTDAYFISTSLHYKDLSEDLKSAYQSWDGPEVVTIIKNGKERMNLFVWRLHGELKTKN